MKKEKLYELIMEVLEEVLEEELLDEEGKKDACYHKVKSRYKVWPSAYASGALVKCRKVGAKNWGNKSKKEESLREEFETHDMYNPKTGEKFVAKKEQDHKSMAAKGYVHVDPKRIEKVLRDEGGASGMDPFLKEFGEEMEEEIIKALDAMPNVGQHKDKDYILHDDAEVKIVKERKKNCGCGQDPCKTYGIQETKKKSGASNISEASIATTQKGSPKKRIVLVEKRDPKKGTGRKPPGSGRRLYTDEDPSDTVSVKFATVQDIKDTLSKKSFKSKSHKRQSQIINLIHQRSRAAYQNAKDPEVKARLKKSFDYATKRKEASKRKTQAMNKKKDESVELQERCQKGYKTHDTQKTKKMFGRTYRNCVKAEENQEIEEKKDGKGASSKGYSLRDWFKGGGWVQTGGKYDGKPCAKQPGQKTKPYCRDPDDRAKLSKKERDKRARKKRKEDPNPDRRGKAKNVRQKKKKNEVLDMRKGMLYEGDESILEMFKGATLDDGGLVCEACLFETLQEASCGCPDLVAEAEYRGRKVKLNKPMRGDVKKFKVYVKDPKTGNIKKVNFGDPNMRIKKSNPKRRKSFRARHNCDNPGPKTKARYWSCRKW
jgi:hypothetical protein